MTQPEQDPIELLPCPFCGYKKMSVDDISGDRDPDGPKFWVECGYCSAQGPVATEEESISIWNERFNSTELEELQAKVKALEYSIWFYEHDEGCKIIDLELKVREMKKAGDAMADTFGFISDYSKQLKLSKAWAEASK